MKITSCLKHKLSWQLLLEHFLPLPDPVLHLSSCNAVKATGVFCQYKARTRSRSVLVRDATFVKQTVKAKLPSFSFLFGVNFHLETSF